MYRLTLGRGAQYGKSGGFTLGNAGRAGRRYPSTGKERSRGALDWGSQSWSRTLENNAFGRIRETVGTSQGARLQGASVTWPGGTGRRRQWHHSGLWCDIFTTELDVEEGWTAGH